MSTDPPVETAGAPGSPTEAAPTPSPAAPPPRCLNCEAFVTGQFCAACGQRGGVHVLTMGEVAHDFVHSVLHLDSTVWRTLRSLLLKPGELTNEFVAGRRARYLPPFRLYLVISIAFFAFSSLLPEGDAIQFDGSAVLVAPPETGAPGDGGKDEAASRAAEAAAKLDQVAADPEAPAAVRELAVQARQRIAGGESPAGCALETGWARLDRLLANACRQLEKDGGQRLGQVFLATAPKLMFLFLPLMAAVAMLFYWRPRRLYAEHLVLFLHTHAFVFLWLIVTSGINAIARLDLPGAGLLGALNLALMLYLPWYVYRAMRVVYAEGRARTAAKMAAIGGLYFMMLGFTVTVGIVYSLLSL
jgi:hypothetical protein